MAEPTGGSAATVADYPASWEADVVLHDGTTTRVRPLRSSDADALQAFHMGQSERSTYFRFFHPLLRLPPRDLLDALLGIERANGRRRDGGRWGPRTLDLDLLVYDDLQCEEAGLCLPHPRIGERAFVLVPLAELAPELHIPGSGIVGELLARLDAGACEAVDG